MKKEIKILLALIGIIAILLLSFYLVAKKSDEKDQQVPQQNVEPVEIISEVMTNEEKAGLGINRATEYEVISRDENGVITAYKVVSLPENVLTKVDWMSEEEIADKKISTESRYQVLERDEDGSILSYKVINNDSDIVTEFGQYTFIK